ncbi:MAG TPA: nucleoside phosphorylase [Tenuifilaceae bacterium]|nr:nucleoside phosphorylase [Tenuifilaceae bacterium]HPE17208.1 nucleoside phosphorylase [Tenuifilaceae bacterium]HPJ44744.1 nucleoside phosphorylase [Tenuifilaceae bacterium]HPQ33320.1 nucleoside phosphorylase [Tenuifilaceae bacterium]HRX68647.1 nucleoside phosphorylase [Tenuifilaceae bacterium]
MRRIEESELIVNPDGSIFHLHLRPQDIADKIILVGDPGRVDTIASFFGKIEVTAANREFKTVTGIFNGERVSAISTGIGTDNIDIVVNELDALVNIDLNERVEKANKRRLQIVRLGTSGALQANIPIDSFVLTGTAIGFDGLLNFYQNRDSVCNLEMEQAFLLHTSWNPQCAKPYFVNSSPSLMKLFEDFTINGVTISAPGFYGPQGRVLRLPLADENLNSKIESFSYNGRRITNFEMESSAINGLSLLLGHDSLTICSIIANRVTKQASPDYKQNIRRLIEKTLERLTQ